MKVMSERRILITGVGRGLGLELASRFVERGHTVFGTTRTGEAPIELAGCVCLDLRDESSIVSALGLLGEQIDGIDLLVNCAGADARMFGAGEDARGPFDVDAATFNAVLDANVTGPMVVTREALPLLRRGQQPMIVNVSSQLGSMQVAARKGRDTAYCVSKAALNMLGVKSAAALEPDGIGVVMMHPGWVATDMGGPAADLSVDEAGVAIVATIESLTLADTGRFIRWDGHDHPW